jgi:uncharacterized protein (TIGR02145 family)
MKNTMIFFFFTMMFVIGCSDNSTNNPDNTVSDTVFTDARDGKKYGIVKINSQVWMSENLNASTYRNGDPILYARSSKEWLDAAIRKEGAWCYYDNDFKNGEVYGKLYNWYAVSDVRGLAPKGYHIPSDLECDRLVNYLGGDSIAGQKMKSKTGWFQNGNGTNSSGFNGFPGGDCSLNGRFSGMTSNGDWWNSTESDSSFASFLSLNYLTPTASKNSYWKYQGMSVRCLRD